MDYGRACNGKMEMGGRVGQPMEMVNDALVKMFDECGCHAMERYIDRGSSC